ncbi:NAD(P)-dependent oxidoreductase [Nguyenibacter sp. L1]|uniref:NAD(P)-dependent oxidoreductase n=1 Tax=Nguyenibacter sp. L1 TaxID=3049350 RepID=UPI002B49ED08|nr:NAD(P)-dependent oxidoreductase [Nguyenibacter sp. L1]WRH89081.1 NAD(P)-dependent oxidoreductase [Nguyenibacter sp. L1]
MPGTFPPRVVNQLGPEVRAALDGFGSRLRIVDASRESDAPWDYAAAGFDRADILLTGPSAGWKRAPAEPPAGWAADAPGAPRWVQIVSAGVDGFPPWLLRDRIVTCGRGDSAVPIAEYVLAALLLRTKRLDALRPGSPDAWRRDAAIITGAAPLGSLDGQVLGLAGFGAIGQAVAARAHGFGLRVLAWRRGKWPAGGHGPVEPVDSLAELARRSDHLVLALPLTEETAGCVNADVLLHARPGLHLVNVARGGLVDHAALLAALDRGQVGFATLDVTSPEPLPAGHPFYSHPAVRLTPHLSWSGPVVRENSARRIAENIERFFAGQPLRDVVDAARGY